MIPFKQIATLAVALLCAASAQAQAYKVMQIHRTDGTVQTIPTAEIDSVTFATVQPVELFNQCELGGNVWNIASLTEVTSTQGLTIQIYGNGEGEAVSIDLPLNAMGRTYDLATATDVSLSVNGKAVTPTSGSLEISKDRTGRNLILVMTAKWQGGSLRADYNGTYSKSFNATGRFTTAIAGGATYTGRMATVLSMTEESGTRHIAFGPADTTTPAEMQNGDCVVWFNLSALKWGTGTVDLAQSAGSYTLRLIDYRTQRTIEAGAGTTGTITTYNDPMGNPNVCYVALDVTLDDGTHIVADYYGSVTTVQSLDDLNPKPSAENGLTIIDASGNVTSEAALTALKVETSGQFTKFYLLKNKDDSTSDSFLTPMIKIQTALIGTGELDLANAEARTWEVKYQGFQLSSQDNDYMNKASGGTLFVEYDATTKQYSIRLSLLNLYESPWGTSGGDGSTLTINYDGPAL